MPVASHEVVLDNPVTCIGGGRPGVMGGYVGQVGALEVGGRQHTH